MKNPLRLFIFSLLLCLANTCFAQFTNYCGSSRYDNEVFPTTTISSNIPYGSNTDVTGSSVTLTMDIYEPAGDTATIRPLIVWAHGGSFIFGTKNDADVDTLCVHFAKRGYVCASINYRLGIAGTPNQTSVLQAVYRAVQDMKAAIRFFRKDASTANLYKTDSTLIFAGGSSAGAVTALHLAYLDQVSELPSPIDTTVLGNLEGNSGNPGYASNVNAVVNLCGALGDKNWITAGEEPLCSMHGTTDNVVPYATAMLLFLNIFPIMVVDGSYSLNDYATSIGISNAMYTYYGQGHVPYASNAATMDTTIRFASNFLYSYMGCTPVNPNPLPNTFINVSVNENNSAKDEVLIYPNPATTQLSVSNYTLSGKSEIEIYNLLGEKIYSQQLTTNKQLTAIDVSNFFPGIYFAKLRFENSELVKKIVIQ